MLLQVLRVDEVDADEAGGSDGDDEDDDDGTPAGAGTAAATADGGDVAAATAASSGSSDDGDGDDAVSVMRMELRRLMCRCEVNAAVCALKLERWSEVDDRARSVYTSTSARLRVLALCTVLQALGVPVCFVHTVSDSPTLSAAKIAERTTPS